MVRILIFMSSSPCRPREHSHSERETIRLTHWVESLESKHGTSKRREIHQPVTPLPRREDVSSASGSYMRIDNWAKKAIRRNTQGTGRMKYLKTVFRKQKNGFREGTKAVSKKRKVTEKKWVICLPLQY